MIKETMTREQLLMTAVNLGIPDRVPVAPIIDVFAYRHKNVPLVAKSGGAVMPKDAASAIWPKTIQALRDTFDDLGGYDAKTRAGLAFPASSWRGNMPAGEDNVMPGVGGIPEDFAIQFREREVMTIEDYDTIINRGWNSFCEQWFPRESHLSLEQIDAAQKKLLEVYVADAAWWKARGVPVMTGANVKSCEASLSMARTLPKFTLDLHRYPDKVLAALEAMVPDTIQNVINDTKASGIPWVSISLTRGSGTYYSVKIYEKFFFPQLKKMVDAFTSAGIISVLHCDTDWTLNFPYFKELPKGKCVCQLDSTSNIFKAKEMLNNHMCLMGDVPPSMLSLGTTEDVITYCRKLIDIIGKGGGFILGTGCATPIDAKFENMKALVDTGKSYYPHRHS